MKKQNCKWSNVDCKLYHWQQQGQISCQILAWASGNDWYHTDIQTNQLRLEQTFGQVIESITKDLDYQNQPKLRRQIFDCYDMLMAKCRQIDMVCRVGCRSEEEMLELHFLKSKAIGAAAELADVLTLLQQNTGTTDFADTYGINCTDNKCIKKKDNDEWMTFSEAAEVVGVTKGTISKWASEGKFRDNGRTDQKRRLLKISVLEVKLQKENEDLKKDALDLRRDAGKLG
jgi:hypothetical protein